MISLLEFLSNLLNPAPADVQDRHQRYLAEAVDMCDLENRMRALDGDKRSLHFSHR